VQAFRRGREESGAAMSFGFAQFGDPEAAWKASTCLTGLKLCGQEIKVLVEEGAEVIIGRWRKSQKAALKVNTEEELAWELERKSVSCRSQIDAKIEEIYGASSTSGGGGAATFAAQRKQELRDREQARIDRCLKRKAWRVAEYDKEKERVESAEKRMRRSERDKDDADRIKEGTEAKPKEEEDKLAKIEDATSMQATMARFADSTQLCEMVDRVQSEPRDSLFKMDMDVNFLRNEKVFEKKLRPWLERKVELFMGGPQSDLVEYILRRVNGASDPETLISDLMRFLDDSSEGLVERMWRMLAFELMRGGLVMQKPHKKEPKRFSN